MSPNVTRRKFLATASAPTIAANTVNAAPLAPGKNGWIQGRMSGARALVTALQLQGANCVFGIPGAQQNELWDEFKQCGLRYVLVTHEFSASVMADGYARSTGMPGVLCVVPGPGLTNALTGIGEALLDSIPMVCIVGDVARGAKYAAFQVHDLPNAELLKPVTKQVWQVADTNEIPGVIRAAYNLAQSGEPGPVGVVAPYDLLLETERFHCAPPAPVELPFDEAAYARAVALLSNKKNKIGIYAGLGCMNYADRVTAVAELLEAPVATTVSGKGVIDDRHPLAVGWGYGKQGTITAEHTFKSVDTLLAVGARFSEVGTAFYNIPKHKRVIHVDINPHNLGRVVETDVCVHADAGLFLDRLLVDRDCLQRKCNTALRSKIVRTKKAALRINCRRYAKCGIDPVEFLYTLRKCTNDDAMTFVDVTMTEHWAAEMYEVRLPRTYFNPTDNQSMGWSIPAALGAQAVCPDKQIVTITGDGCFMMSAMELSTAARECLPVKFFILDDQAYHYMQRLQESAYQRTTATELGRLDYASLAQGFGIGYNEINATPELEAGINASLHQPGPVLTRVSVDYRDRPVRWIDAVRERYVDQLSTRQQMRFLARLGTRSFDMSPEND